MNNVKFSFSIIVVTYNPDWTRLRLTLDSILAQAFKDYEIIIADDGSKDALESELLDYFKEKAFNQFQLVHNEVNQGTVKNLISALRVASGKYVRDFGPGDFFYNEHTLQNLYDFMEQGSYDACFGMVKGYIKNEDGSFRFEDFYHPFDLLAYIKKDKKRIKKNLVLYRDNPSGASTSYTKDFYLEYLEKIEGCIIYVEDIFIILAAVEGRTFSFFENYLVYYEMQASVVEKNDHFKSLLEHDIVEFYQLLYSLYPNDPIVKRQHKLLPFYKIHNKYLMALLRFFVNPDMVGYLFSHYRQVRNNIYHIKNPEDGFLSQN